MYENEIISKFHYVFWYVYHIFGEDRAKIFGVFYYTLLLLENVKYNQEFSKEYSFFYKKKLLLV